MEDKITAVCECLAINAGNSDENCFQALRPKFTWPLFIGVIHVSIKTLSCFNETIIYYINI